MAKPQPLDRILHNYKIQHVHPGEHKHSTPGWINVHCPFCAGGDNYHLGLSTSRMVAHCWRCGRHPVINTLSKLLHMSPVSVRAVLSKYPLHSKEIHRERCSTAVQTNISPFKFPPHQPITTLGRRYLRSRRFVPHQIVNEWGVVQTLPVSVLDGTNYGNRLIVPVHFEGTAVSFVARDFTGKHPLKYLVCPKQREAYPHKHLLYKHPNTMQSTWIVVEGVTDVWRLGRSAVATFGIEFTTEQVLELSNIGDSFIIMYDNERQAQRQANRLQVKLRALRKHTRKTTVDGDPADLSQQDANNLVAELLGEVGP